jgi:hypothetical protein
MYAVLEDIAAATYAVNRKVWDGDDAGGNRATHALSSMRETAGARSGAIIRSAWRPRVATG